MLHNQRDDWCHCKLHKWRRTSRYWRWLDYDHISWYLGLLLLAGVYRGRLEPVIHLWSVEQGMPLFGAAMARNRFQMITRWMRYDSKDTRLERRQRDQMAPIRDIHDTFAARCRVSYKSRTQLCIDYQATRVLLQMIEPWNGTARGCAADNFFTSFTLADALLTRKITYCVEQLDTTMFSPPEIAIIIYSNS